MSPTPNKNNTVNRTKTFIPHRNLGSSSEAAREQRKSIPPVTIATRATIASEAEINGKGSRPLNSADAHVK